jgi:integrase
MPLSDLKCRNAKSGPKLQKLSDGGGLQLWVKPTGGRLWRLAYRFDGRQKLLALGSYPTVSLADARLARDEAKRLLEAGYDPATHKKEEAEAQTNTFRTIAEEYISRVAQQGRSDATIEKTKWLLTFAYPVFGDLSIKKIDAATILKALQQVEARGRYESANRLRSTVGSIFRYAIATTRAESDPTIALRGALIRPNVKSRAAIIEPEALGALLRAIDSFGGQPSTCAALKLIAVLFPRPGELRAARWSEFDFEKAVWTIPAGRMKMRRPHRTPLPTQAITILKELQELANGDLAFPCIRTDARPISEGTLNAALRRLGYSKDEVTPHGFRATASTLLNESGKWHPDAIERQLAHIEGNDVRRAYARGEHWNERVAMMQWWADHLDELKRIDNRAGTISSPPSSSVRSTVISKKPPEAA